MTTNSPKQLYNLTGTIRHIRWNIIFFFFFHCDDAAHCWSESCSGVGRAEYAYAEHFLCMCAWVMQCWRGDMTTESHLIAVAVDVATFQTVVLKGRKCVDTKCCYQPEINRPCRTPYISSHYLPPRYRFLRLGVASWEGSQFTTRLTLVLFIWTICHSCRVCKGRRSLSQSAVGSFLGMKWN